MYTKIETPTEKTDFFINRPDMNALMSYGIKQGYSIQDAIEMVILWSNVQYWKNDKLYVPEDYRLNELNYHKEKLKEFKENITK